MLKKFFSKKEQEPQKDEQPKEKKKREVTVFREYFELFAVVPTWEINLRRKIKVE